jgi:hypothetical protein
LVLRSYEKPLLPGDKSTAIDDFDKCPAIPEKTGNEYQFAETDLKALAE